MTDYASFEGNLTRDPELRFTQSGKAVASISVACNRRWKNAQGEQQEEVSYYDCSAWDELGQNINDSLHKGDRVVVIARMAQRSWEDGEGQKRSKVEFTIDSIGPSLRWANVSITKTDKNGNDHTNRPAATTSNETNLVDQFSGEPF